jgi:hypothetical protein
MVTSQWIASNKQFAHKLIPNVIDLQAQSAAIPKYFSERNLAAFEAKCVGRGGFRPVTSVEANSALSLGVTPP